MTDVLIGKKREIWSEICTEGRKEIHRENACTLNVSVKTEAENEKMHLQAKECHRLLATVSS